MQMINRKTLIMVLFSGMVSGSNLPSYAESRQDQSKEDSNFSWAKGIYFTTGVGFTCFNQDADYTLEIIERLTYKVPLKTNMRPGAGIGIGYMVDMDQWQGTLEYFYYVDSTKTKNLNFEAQGSSSNHKFSRTGAHYITATLGYELLEKIVPYVGFGFVRSQFTYNYKFDDFNPEITKSSWGTAFLGGCRFNINNHFSLKLEYQMQKFPKFYTGHIAPTPLEFQQSNIKPYFKMFLINFTYKI